jgi:hypothetical protein
MLRQSLNEKQIVLTLRRRKIQETTNALVQWRPHRLNIASINWSHLPPSTTLIEESKACRLHQVLKISRKGISKHLLVGPCVPTYDQH